MFFLGYILEGFVEYVCAWVGYGFVKLITLGRWNIDPDGGSESVLGAAIGFFVLLGTCILILWIFQT